MNIKINIVNKRPTVEGTPIIVCGNSGYTIEFTFDAEWSDVAAKVARFVYAQAGKVKAMEVAFTGVTVEVPILSNTREVSVGVYAGDLRTTTPARILCERSILCGDSEEVVDQDTKKSVMQQIEDAKVDAIEGIEAAGSDQVERIATVLRQLEDLDVSIEAVEEVLQRFDNAEKEHILVIEKAGSDQVEAVNDAGTTKMGQIENTMVALLGSIEAAGAEQLEAVTAAGARAEDAAARAEAGAAKVEHIEETANLANQKVDELAETI